MIFFRRLLKHKIWLSVIAVVLVAGGYVGYQKVKGSGTAVQYVTQDVTKGTLTTSVSGTGQVEASDQIDIKPQTDGRLTNVNVKKNQQVKTGDVIAVIDQQSAANSVAQARASLQQAQANYDKLMAGATQNTIATQQLSLNSAQQALDQAKTDYKNTVADQQTSVNKSLSTFLNADLQAVPSDLLGSVTVTVSGGYTGTTQGQYTISTFTAGDGLHYQTSGLGNQSGVLNRGLSLPLGNGLYVTFSSTGTLSPSTVWTIDIPNKRSSSYINNLSAYNAAVQNQTEAVQKAQASIDSAQNNLTKTQLSYDSTVAAPTASDIASAKAQTTSAQAQLANAETAYQNTILKAPFDGVVAAVDFSTGDKVTAGTAIATLITKQQVAKFSLNEVDAAKVKVGQQATLTFSAVSDLTLTGKVADVDNIGTVSQNVVSFNVKILLDTQNELIKPGMSVSVTVITDVKQDILMVPTAAIKTSNSQSYVEALVNGKPEQHSVTAGSSNDTDTEVSGDVKEGDKVITQTLTATSSTTKTSSAGFLQGLFGGNRSSQTRSTTSSSKSSSSGSSSKSSGGSNVSSGSAPMPPGGF
jgi:HlyD family secretion protein